MSNTPTYSVVSTNIPTTGSIDMNKSLDDMSIAPVLTGKQKSLLNLKPIKKGQILNPTGKRGLLIKDRITKKLNAKRADNVAENIINQSELGIIESQKLLLKLTGDLDDKPQVNIQNNNIPNLDLIELAREMLRQQNDINI
jgi:hypothetical protein